MDRRHANETGLMEADVQHRPDIARLILDARAAQGVWAETPLRRRLGVITRLRHLIARNAAELSQSVGERPGRAEGETAGAGSPAAGGCLPFSGAGGGSRAGAEAAGFQGTAIMAVGCRGGNPARAVGRDPDRGSFELSAFPARRSDRPGACRRQCRPDQTRSRLRRTDAGAAGASGRSGPAGGSLRAAG